MAPLPAQPAGNNDANCEHQTDDGQEPSETWAPRSVGFGLGLVVDGKLLGRGSQSRSASRCPATPTGGREAVLRSSANDLRCAGRDGARGNDIGDHAGDVIWTTRKQSQPDQFFGALSGIADIGENFSDRIGGDNSGKPVRTQQPAVSHDCFTHGFIGSDIGLRIPKDSHDDIALRVMFCLFRSDLAAVHQVLNKRVIGGDLGQGIAAQEIGARVADVDHGELVSRAHERDAGCPQSSELGVLLGALGKFLVRVHEGIAKRGEKSLSGVGVGIEGNQVSDGNRGSDIAACGAAHSVG